LGFRAAFAASYEACNGPLPDVVETRGQHLVSGFKTPVMPEETIADLDFYNQLYHTLRVLECQQIVRADLYGSLACESRLAHTPSPVRAQFQSEEDNNVREFIKCLTPPTPSTRCNTPPPLLSPDRTGLSTTASPPTIHTPSLSLVHGQPALKTAKRKLDDDDCEIPSATKRICTDAVIHPIQPIECARSEIPFTNHAKPTPACISPKHHIGD
jgi:hypothetical protein